jgi:hypothetical protein
MLRAVARAVARAARPASNPMHVRCFAEPFDAARAAHELALERLALEEKKVAHVLALEEKKAAHVLALVLEKKAAALALEEKKAQHALAACGKPCSESSARRRSG